MAKTGPIYGINGPTIRIKGDIGFGMHKTVYVGKENLVGEVIGLVSDDIIIEVYEGTTGLKSGEIVIGTDSPVPITLVPGIPNNIFDGIRRLLSEIAKNGGAYTNRGVSVESLDTARLWPTYITVKKGDRLFPGAAIAEALETLAITHKVMLPPDVEGFVLGTVPDGDYITSDTFIILQQLNGKELKATVTQEWLIRMPRPTAKRYPASVPFITGRRILDTLFPLVKNGTAAAPSELGTGKTTTQYQIARWFDVDIITCIGCGERGNEITQVLEEFSRLVDPKSGNPLMDRTTLIANTSSIPMAVRKASLYSGLILAEYYRGVGYDVVTTVDSTFRWTEALHEISGRLEEAPTKEGFPAYLASRLSTFYKRADTTRGLDGAESFISIIGAVSPQDGDFSEPMTQNIKRFAHCFRGLDKLLTYTRHLPAIQWITSYSEYLIDLAPWYTEHVNKEFVDYRNRMVYLLNQESSLMEIVKLIGGDVLPDDQKLILEIIKVIHVGFLRQNVFHKDDIYVPMEKQFKMMDIILHLHKKPRSLISMGMSMSILKEDKTFDKATAMRYDIPNDRLDTSGQYKKDTGTFHSATIERNV